MALSVQASDFRNDEAPLIDSEESQGFLESIDRETSTVTFSSSHIVKDRFNFVYLTFHLLGLSTVLPFTFFMTASDYWMFKFRNVTDKYPPTNFEEKTHFQAMFLGYFCIASNVPALIMFICNIYIIKRFSQEMRNSISFITIILFFGATLSYIKVNTDSWQFAFFELTMSSVVVISSASALFQGSIVDLASIFPATMMHTMVSGQGIAEVIPAVTQILSLLGDTHPTTSAMIYFAIAISMLVFTFCCFGFMHRTNYFKFYMTRSQVVFNMEPVIASSFSSDLYYTFTSLWPHVLTIFLTSFISTTLLPGIVTLGVSTEADAKSPWTGRFFLPVACFLIYSLADVTGRLISGWLSVALKGIRHVLILSIARISFVPLLMLCNLHPRKQMPVVLDNDAYYIGLMTLFGVTNGYCFSQAMVLGSREVPSRLRNEASVLLSLSLGIGLCIGSFTSVGLIKIL